ncbi:hypothetical protein C8Q80DRAFT_1108341 [Daedaleopsis nitida]|nr:hypothetical protein C8Q80DRAFT_1108341 [Daedaleopsis nitida]
MQTVCPIHIPLPLEVEERIIDILESDVKALRVCALTCRAWRIRSRIHLFKAIRLTDRPRLDVLSHHLQGLPFLATAIREMTIESSDVILAPLSLRLPSLRLLHVRDATLAYHHSALHAMKATSQLGALYLTRATFYTAMDFVRFIGALPGLRELRCHHVTMKSIKTTNTESILQKTVTIISKRCRISTLQVSNFI